MANHGDFSPEALERARRTVRVAEIFADHAELIVAALPEVPEDHVLVAVVDAEHEFGGTHHVNQTELVERVPVLESEGAWAMVFSPGSSVEDVRRRTDDYASIAAQRAAAIDRIIARRSASS